MSADPAAGETETSTPLSAHLALGLASVIFGLFPVFGKSAFKEVAPFAVAALRVSFGSVSLALAARFAGSPPLPAAQLRPLAVCALFGIVINQLLFLKGLHLSTATHAGILVAATPAISYALALALGREQRRGGAMAGVVLAGGGAAWIALARPPGVAVPETMLAGDLLLIVNVTSYSIYLVLVREVARRADPIRVIAWLFAVGVVAIVPIGLGDLLSVPWGDLSAETWRSLAFILLGPTSSAYLLNTWAIRRTTSTLAAIYVCVQPVIAAIAAYAYGERPPLVETVGATVLILLGVALVAAKPGGGPFPPPASGGGGDAWRGSR